MMSSSYLISLRTNRAFSHFNKQDLNCEAFWVDPKDENHAVVLTSLPLDQRERFQKRNAFYDVEDEANPQTILVTVDDDYKSCYGFEDKLALLFHWRNNGGSKVSEVLKHEEHTNAFEIKFLDGWDAVFQVCKSKWTIDKIELKVIPYFDSFRKYSKKNKPSLIPQDAAASNSYDENHFSQSPPISRPREEDLKSSYTSYKSSLGPLTDTEKEYLKMHQPKNYRNWTEKPTDIFENDYNKYIDFQREFKDHSHEIAFPDVKGFFKSDGMKIKSDIERKFSCLISNGLKGRKDNQTKKNYTVTLLVSAVIKRLNVHLVQGNAKYLDVDENLHIDLPPEENQSLRCKGKIFVRPDNFRDGTIEKELRALTDKNFNTLAVSVGIRFSHKLILDEFADFMLKHLGDIFGHSSKHIYLCEGQRCALLRAYHYYLGDKASKIDEEAWNACQKDLPQRKFEDLKSKVQVMDSFPQEFRSNTMTVVCLPISQTLDPSSCPHAYLKIREIEWKIKNLGKNMLEQDMYKFDVGATHFLFAPYPSIRIYLYCTQDWDINVAESIASSIYGCLQTYRDSKFPELYIFPPGIFPTKSLYPVDFAIQKYVQALDKYEAMLQRFSFVNFVVPEREYCDSFRKILNYKTSNLMNFRKKIDYKPESFVTISGEDNTNLKQAFQELKQKLESVLHTCKFKSAELSQEDFDAFIKRLQSSPPANVHVTNKGKTVTVTGLTQFAVNEFLSRHKELSANQKPSQNQRKPSNSQSPVESFAWSIFNSLGYQHTHNFSKADSIEIEKAFQSDDNGETVLDIGIFNFTEMSCWLNGSKGTKERLLRHEMIRDLKPEPVTVSSDNDKLFKTIEKELVKSKVNCILFKVDKIEHGDKIIGKRFKKKSDLKSFKCYQGLFLMNDISWHEHFLDHGFQKLFSYFCGKNMCTFYRDPCHFLTDSELDRGSHVHPIFCDVLCNDFPPRTATINWDESKSIATAISVEFKYLSDAHILPRAICSIKMSTKKAVPPHTSKKHGHKHETSAKKSNSQQP